MLGGQKYWKGVGSSSSILGCVSISATTKHGLATETDMKINDEKSLTLERSYSLG